MPRQDMNPTHKASPAASLLTQQERSEYLDGADAGGGVEMTPGPPES